MNKRNVVILGTLLVAAVVGVLYWKGIYPPRTGVEGTIGAANRYQSQQITDSDVVLKDQAVQTFIQSDTFRKLAANPEFQKTAENAVFEAMMASESWRRWVNDLSASEAKKADAFSAEALATIFGSKEMLTLIEANQFEAFIAEALQAEAHSIKDLNKIMEEKNYRELKASEAWTAVEANTALVEMLSTAEGLGAVNKVSEMAKDADFKKISEMAGFVEMASHAEFWTLAENKDFQEALNSEAFQSLAEANSINEALKVMPE